uniref:Sushi domain-containing protein n=1 Tax=Neogobius melanostomus TaxID=47308 RepID=A0A8C6TI28_9GOBI
IMGSFVKEYPSGIRLTYNCRKHFVMEGDSTIQCINGIWERKSITIENKCSPPPEVENAVIMGSFEKEYPSDKVKYQCDHLYELEGRPYKTCSNGQWIGDLQCLSKLNFTKIWLNL